MTIWVVLTGILIVISVVQALFLGRFRVRAKVLEHQLHLLRQAKAMDEREIEQLKQKLNLLR